MHAQNRIVPRASAGGNTPGFKVNTAEVGTHEGAESGREMVFCFKVIVQRTSPKNENA
jgi:hypothetical protein